MREQQLVAISSENRYAESGGMYMPDGVGVETSGQTEEQVRGQDQTVRAEEQEARRAIEDVVTEEIEKAKHRTRGQEAQQQRKEGQSGEAAERPSAQAVKEYFSQSPPAELSSAVKRFLSETEGKPLPYVATRVLVKNYLRLRNEAAENNITNVSFLSDITNELAIRGVNLPAVVQSHERLLGLVKIKGAQGSVSVQGITDQSLLTEAEVLNAKVEATDREDFDELQKALENVVRLTGVPANEKQLLKERIEERIRAVRGRDRPREAEAEYERERGWYGERKLRLQDKNDVSTWIEGIRVGNNAQERRDEFDKLFNRMFDRADADPHADFDHAMSNAGQKEFTDFINLLHELRDEAENPRDEATRRNRPSTPDERGRADLINKLIEKFSAEHKMRELLHNAYFIAETEGDFENFANYCKQFASQFGDLAFMEAPEVETALRVREQVLYQIKREHNGYIPPDLVAYNPLTGGSEWEERTREMMKKLNENRTFGTELDQWKISRALSLSRGMGMVLLRFPEIVAETIIPAPAEAYQSQPSTVWEKLVWELNPLDHKLKRYDMGKETLALLHAATKRTKKGLWSQDELHEALAQKAISQMGLIGKDKRVIDMVNLFRTGGPFSHTGWRPYIAALDENRQALRPMLKRNAGLAMNMIFNRYEIGGQGEERWKFFQEHRGANPHELVDMWNAKEQKGQKGTGFTLAKRSFQKALGRDVATENQKEWQRAEIAMWEKSAGRIPHVILRILTEKTSHVLDDEEKKALLSKIPQVTTELENDLTIAKENLMRRRRELGDAFSDDDDQLQDRDFERIEVRNERGELQDAATEQRRQRAKDFRDAVVNELRSNPGLRAGIQKAGTSGFPFAVTAEDVPWSEFRMGQTGPRGYFTRKINDAFSVAEANEELVNLIKHLQHLNSPAEIVAQLQKIFDKAEIYDYVTAQDAIATIATGVVRFFEKDGITKIPIFGEIMGMVNGARHRGNSYAQTVYGSHSMEWDSDDVYNFTEQLRTVLIGKHGYDLVDQIRKETGGDLWRAMGKKTRTALELLLTTLLFGFVESLVKEK